MAMKPNVRSLLGRGWEAQHFRLGGGADLKFQQKQMKKWEEEELRKRPNELGPLYTEEGWRKPTQREERIQQERVAKQIEEDFKRMKERRMAKPKPKPPAKPKPKPTVKKKKY